ncbi:dethiobiotin synthase [Psychrosphaera sp. B3R10]|nr:MULTISPECIES: dethiobiotin synthase [unclassified Psychrosphaera]MBU2882212.1 dethiobiotin synthase [Psychrosphaera sp. I2R16]MBU2988893.1 dethiobiotin synthase [Psychrosphaera sp. B3R10]
MDFAKLPTRFFVTGTDTEVGKTYSSALIVKALIQGGHSVFPFKPVAAGVEPSLVVNGKAVNEDAYHLWLACNKVYSLDQINPILYQQPIAPHIAAELENKVLDASLLSLLSSKVPGAEYTLIEGAGGWHLPLNNEELMSEWVVNEKLPVLLVVGIKLGCLNHALLTAESIINSGGAVIGWVANFIDGETDIGRKNVEYLQTQLTKRFNISKLFEIQKNQRTLL